MLSPRWEKKGSLVVGFRSMLSFELLCNVVVDWIFYEDEVEMLLIFHVFKSRFSFFFKWEFNVLRNSRCVCGFIEKNIDVYPFYKHSKVSTNFLYGCCLFIKCHPKCVFKCLDFQVTSFGPLFLFIRIVLFFNVSMNCELLLGGHSIIPSNIWKLLSNVQILRLQVLGH